MKYNKGLFNGGELIERVAICSPLRALGTGTDVDYDAEIMIASEVLPSFKSFLHIQIYSLFSRQLCVYSIILQSVELVPLFGFYQQAVDSCFTEVPGELCSYASYDLCVMGKTAVCSME